MTQRLLSELFFGTFNFEEELLEKQSEIICLIRDDIRVAASIIGSLKPVEKSIGDALLPL